MADTPYLGVNEEDPVIPEGHRISSPSPKPASIGLLIFLLSEENFQEKPSSLRSSGKEKVSSPRRLQPIEGRVW
ncbi:hypothetical protein nbrc107696_23910 [Gordonia spumicola]|uniref:Uncharacterized protein n=1 Tax=Gordonia spumicola TaxID=589161 RepID=A0A7I9V9F3_9ACTN|nr:hypothetical protein nbrc107696_23910 [Gordonia spumicola]